MGLVAFVCWVDFRVERNSGALRMLLLVVAGCLRLCILVVLLLCWTGAVFVLNCRVLLMVVCFCVWRVVRLLVGWLWLTLCR